MGAYSATPLPRKLGLAADQRVAFPGAPRGFRSALGPLPPGVVVRATGRGRVDLVVLFTRERAQLEREFPRWTRRLEPAGMLWVAWPKRASKLASDLDFSTVQAIGLRAGLVDTKICAIDDTWSGLRFVRRREDRR